MQHGIQPSFPIRIMTTALAFSPRAEAVLAETHRLAMATQAQLVLIHVGEKTDAKLQQLLEWNKRFPGLEKAEVIWRDGKPEDVLLEESKRVKSDLLVMGALERENFWKRYLGSIGRAIPRKAKTSVLLLTNPRIHPEPFKKLVVNGVENPKTQNTISMAVYLAQIEGASVISVLKEVDASPLSVGYSDGYDKEDQERAKKEWQDEAMANCQALIDSIPHQGIDITTRVVFGHSGHAIANYARTRHADLLVMNSPDRKVGFIDRVFTHDLEYILEQMPTNVLLVHTRGLEK